MKTPPTQIFANPQALDHLSRALLTEFLQRFKDLLHPTYLPLLDPNLAPADFSVLLTTFLASPETVPAPMREAFAAIGDLAAPENRRRFDLALLNAPLSLGIDAQSSPFQQALHLWLHKPFQLPPPVVEAAPVALLPSVALPSPGGEGQGEGALPSVAVPSPGRQDQGAGALPSVAVGALPSPGGEGQGEGALPPVTVPFPGRKDQGAGTLPAVAAVALPSPGGEGQDEGELPPVAVPSPGRQDQGAGAPPSCSSPPAAPPSLTIPLCVLFFELDPRLLYEFIRVFQLDLLERYPDLPHPCPGSEAFADAAAALLTAPERLPARMHGALVAIQELAHPKNSQLLRGLLAQSGITAAPSTPPEHLALEFWLRCPFPFDRLERLRAQLPAEFLALPPQNPDGQNGATVVTPHSALSTPHLNAPGDLAALARFPRNKISHLPPPVRESLNQMLRQRIPYAQIIEKLGEHGKTLNKSNLSVWKKTGYLVWLAEQQRRDDAQAQLHLLFDLVREKDNGKIHEATQQIAALRISQVLAGFDPAILIQALQQEPQAFVRLVQTLPSLSRGGMDCERLLVDLAERKAALQKKANPKPRGISPQSLKYLEQKLKLM